MAAYYWDMEAAFDSSGGRLNDWFGDEEPVTRLIFDRAGRVHAANVCNSLDWNYSTHGSKAIRFTPSKGVTLMACRGELMLRQERMYAEIPKIRRYALEASASSTAQRLTLFLADGGKWQFTEQATPQTRYGHPGRNIELEIALDLVPCQPGASNACEHARCDGIEIRRRAWVAGIY
ncbi:META domain-containing protein [Comamonas sp. 4034]|uniref:META domain-containing protein n=1 Tax=Comamonas sp. 4034 TaxID=3156455 RepID=UPI003D200E90